MTGVAFVGAFAAGSTRIAVKYCGMTRAVDAEYASTLGVEAVGLVFHPASPRSVDLARSRAVAAALGAQVARVGVFVDPAASWVEDAIAAADLDVLQFHGDEPPQFCARFGRPYLKAIRVAAQTDVEAATARFPHALAWVMDTYDRDRHGGTGLSFDWHRLTVLPSRRVVVAGGLGPGNVATAIARSHAAAVDVSSGIEAAPGIKDRGKMRAFLAAVRAAPRVE
jgi:phosphoribosylanthranilate isomerase